MQEGLVAKIVPVVPLLVSDLVRGEDLEEPLKVLGQVALHADPGGAIGPDCRWISPQFRVGGVHENLVMFGNKAIELVHHPRLFLAEGGAFECFEEILPVLVLARVEHFAVDVVTGEVRGMIVENIKLAAQSEFRREAAQDGGEDPDPGGLDLRG